MDIFTAIRARRSSRSFLPTPIPEAWILEMLDAARLAPTPGNGQGNLFGVVRDPAIKADLATAAGEQMWIAQAPVIFAGCARLDWDLKDAPDDDFGKVVNHLRFTKDFVDYLCRYPEKRPRNLLMANGGPCMPLEHIFLTAVSRGLSACFIGYLDVDAASRALRLPDDIACLFLLPVGYAAEPPKAIERKTIEETSFFDRWQS